MTTKHQQILNYIESLRPGAQISVRKIARVLDVSEGTAYRAIKEAENEGLVSTMERIGTVRIERKEKQQIERLTFAEVVTIVEGTVLGGRGGLHKSLNRFIIGAMQLLQTMSNQPQVGETIEDMILRNFEEMAHGDGTSSIRGEVTPLMTASGGTLATGALTTLIQEAARVCLRRMRSVDVVIENMTMYSLKPAAVDSRIEATAQVLDFGRRYAKVEVVVRGKGDVFAKALLTAQWIER
ncbi:hypothetical protein AAC03nite_32230 [Alicyclobacillus acidoterrestris]|nr:hypothetical protein AAC03nite_32230 [Alicyclobacillus acidoterrestris]